MARRSLRTRLSGIFSGRYPAETVPRTVGGGFVEQSAFQQAAVSAGYAPELDGEPDPGEVVWAWVPYEDDPSRGKDRPVLLLERRGDTWVGLQMTSKDHDRDAEDEARHGRHWMDVGTGAWDREGRSSEVRLDRLVVLTRDAIRREGSILDRRLFEEVVAAASPHHH